MAQTGFTPIQLYRTSTAAAVPVDTNLTDGELAINTTDEKLYFKNAAGTVKLLASAAASSGDVVGPASSTAGAVPVYSDTTGKLLASGVAPGTSGNVLVSNGTAWTSAAPAASGISTGKSIAMAMIFGF